jgi:hypothetical protein
MAFQRMLRGGNSACCGKYGHGHSANIKEWPRDGSKLLCFAQGQSDFGRVDISTVKDALGSMHWDVDDSQSRCTSTSLPPLMAHIRPALPE